MEKNYLWRSQIFFENFMKPRQSSIYRKLELLHLWASSLVDRCPKSLSYQIEGKAIMDDLNNALLVTKFALKAPKGEERLRHIEMLDVYLADLDTHITELRERSKPANAQARVLTRDQYASYMRDYAIIQMEIDSWRKSNIVGLQAPAGRAGSGSD